MGSEAVDTRRERAFDRTLDRRALIATAFVLIPIVGYIDGHTSAYIAFSIFYVLPISLVAWRAERLATTAAAVVLCGVSGLAADLWTIHARPSFAVVNLISRVVLFSVVGLVVTRLRTAMSREQELSRLRRRLMDRVAEEVREPLAEIYAKVVDLGFDHETLSPADLRALVAELADASHRATRLVESLADDTDRSGATSA